MLDYIYHMTIKLVKSFFWRETVTNMFYFLQR